MTDGMPAPSSAPPAAARPAAAPRSAARPSAAPPDDRVDVFPITVRPRHASTPALSPRAETPPRPRPRLNPLAVLALVLGLLLSPLAALFGHLAAGQITRSYGAERGLAIAWIAAGLGWVWLLVLVIVVGGVWVALAS